MQKSHKKSINHPWELDAITSQNSIKFLHIGKTFSSSSLKMAVWKNLNYMSLFLAVARSSTSGKTKPWLICLDRFNILIL